MSHCATSLLWYGCCNIAAIDCNFTVGRAGFPWQRGKKSNWRVETFVWQWRRLESRLPTNGLRIFAKTGSNGPSIGASVTNLLEDFKSVRSDLFEGGMPLAVLLESVQV